MPPGAAAGEGIGEAGWRRPAGNDERPHQRIAGADIPFQISTQRRGVYEPVPVITCSTTSAGTFWLAGNEPATRPPRSIITAKGVAV